MLTEERWRTVWRALMPRYTADGIAALRQALATNSPALIDTFNTLPCIDLVPGRIDPDAPCVAACPICYPLWKGGLGLESIADVEAAMCRVVGESVGIDARVFTNWFDGAGEAGLYGTRAEKRAALLAELDAAGTH